MVMCNRDARQVLRDGNPDQPIAFGRHSPAISITDNGYFVNLRQGSGSPAACRSSGMTDERTV